MLEVRGWRLEAVVHVLASNLIPLTSYLLSLSLDLSRTLADFFSILLRLLHAWLLTRRKGGFL
jgi:hypothetical protein